MGRTLADLIALAGLAALSRPAFAQTATTIIPDGAATGLGTGSVVQTAGRVTVIAGGMLAGGNLFHSFSTFDLAAGDTARWTATVADPAAVTNVINRVTGGAVSTINGRIDTTALPNAAFFFINPAGIVLSSGARVDVPGAAHFTTAESLRFADGATFSVQTPGGSTLSIAAPSAFGFLGAQGAITMTANASAFASGGLDLSARDITMSGAHLAASSIRATAVGAGEHEASLAGAPIGGAQGSIALRESEISVGPGGAQFVGGAITLADSTLLMRSTDEAQQGELALLADRVSLAGSGVQTVTAGHAASGSIRVNARAFSLDNASLETGSLGGSDGDAGNILVTAKIINVADDSLISTSTQAAGKAGDITLDAGYILIDRSLVGASSECADQVCTGLGKGGTIRLRAGSLVIDDDALVSASAFGDADAGAIDIAARNITIANSSVVRSDAAREGNAGAIGITAAALTLDGASVVSETSGTGNAGSISVTVSGHADLRDTVIGSSALEYSQGNAGKVVFNAGRMDIYASAISSEVLEGSTGSAGAVTVNAARLRLDGGALIDSTTSGEGSGGKLDVTVSGTLELYSGSAISADTRGDGAGGDVRIDARQLQVDNALISADGYAGGKAGAVSVAARYLLVTDGADISSDTRGSGAGGSVDVTAAQMVVDNAYVSADSYDSGASGAINLKIDDLMLFNTAKVRSASFGTGAGGAVEVDARKLSLDGNSSIYSDSLNQGASGVVRVTATSLEVANDSYITSDGVSEGGGGAVSVKADRLTLVSGGFIAAETYQDGVSGEVDINARTLLLDGGHIATQARPGSSGNAGSVHITADTITARHDSFIASGTFNVGSAGNLEITANRISIQDTSFFGTDSNGAGRAGTVHVTAQRLALLDGGTISSTANDAGNGGDIIINASDLILRQGSIATSAGEGGSGDAGDISITADRLALVRGVIVSDSYGTGSAGTIGVDAGTFTLDGGAVSGFASASAHNAGAITLKIKAGLALKNGAAITASSANARSSGSITISAGSLLATGGETAITTSNTYDGGSGALADAAGAAGKIGITAGQIALAEGASLASNSLTGPAGDITVTMPPTGIFKLVGKDSPGVVTTSSGPGTGGRIVIASPLALISNGGSILAQGQLGGALLELGARYFIQSVDRSNLIAVDGAIRIDSNLYDVSAGTTLPMVAFLDASKVLLGQCASERATGEASRIGWRNVGPYAPELRPANPPTAQRRSDAMPATTASC